MTLPPSPVGEHTSALDDLIARVEAATGADRELDEAAEIAVRGGEAVHGMTRYTGEPTVGIRRPNTAYRTGFAVEPCYPLTASLDAVLALVADKRPGKRVSIGSVDGGGWRAQVGPAQRCIRKPAATPALALLAACLRALRPSSEARSDG